MRLWELEAEALLAAGDPGLIPWVPLTKTALAPDVLMTQCRDRLELVSDPTDRAGLKAVTQILAGLAFPDRRFLDLFGGAKAMIESPVLDEVIEILTKQIESETTVKVRVSVLREGIVANLEARLGSVPADRIAPLNAITDETRLKALLRLAATCPNVEAFIAELASGK